MELVEVLRRAPLFSGALLAFAVITAVLCARLSRQMRDERRSVPTRTWWEPRLMRNSRAMDWLKEVIWTADGERTLQRLRRWVLLGVPALILLYFLETGRFF